MADVVVMPKLGLLMETGAVSEWLVAEGDQVSLGDVIAEITTEKITYELEAQAEGVLLKIILPEEEEVAVGVPIALIGQPGEDISAFEAVPPGDAGAESAPAVASAAAATTTEPAAAPVHAPGERIVASPAAKKLAGELGVDLALVVGSGPGGRITLADVENAAGAAATAAPPATGPETGGAAAPPGTVPGPGGAQASATPVAKKMAAELGVDLSGVTGSGISGRIRSDDVAAAAAGATRPAHAQTEGTVSAGSLGAEAVEMRGGVVQEIPYAGMRRLIGEHMDASRKLAPMVTYSVLADVQELKLALDRLNPARAEGDKVNVTAVVIKAVALCLRRMPRFNSTLDGDVIKVWGSVNVGVAVALSDGLIVPVVRQADLKTVGEISREVRDLAQRARENRLLPDEVSGGTFTVSTLGSYRSVDFFAPIINQPEAAILGVGRMRDSVVAVDGMPVVHATMGLSLACDHRILDGAPAAEFLGILTDYLAEPLSLVV